MGLLVPIPRTTLDQRNFSGRPTATWGTTLTANGTAHVEGANTEVIASTTREATVMVVTLHGMHTSAALTQALVNIKVGASFEYTIAPNLVAGWSAVNSVAGPRRYVIPVRIPRGTRIGASLRAVIGSDVCYIQIELLNLPHLPAGAAVEALGASTATSSGTGVTPGTTSEGSWVSMGTTTRRWRWAYLAMSQNTDATATAQHVAGDVGTGSAPIAGLENFGYVTSATEWINPVDDDTWRPCDIPSGTALQARLQSHSSDVEVKQMVLYGVY